jgi:uncharacterized membrane protein YphA (DoxX/SURF4 family)
VGDGEGALSFAFQLANPGGVAGLCRAGHGDILCAPDSQHQYTLNQTNDLTMKITCVIARFLLGLIFLVFGLNGFFHFLPMSRPPSGTAAQFFAALFVSNYLVVIFLLQIAAAIPLLLNRYVPLALTMLAPIIVNILLTTH